MSPLTASVVGAGAGGMLSIRALAESARYELVAVADLSPEARSRVAAEFPGVTVFEDYATMFAESPTDVICVSTYAPSHEPITRAALEIAAPKGMLVEKPLGDTVDAGARVLAVLSEQDVPVVVPHGLMAQSSALEIIERVRAGVIGELRVVEMECSGWDLINAGIHWIQFFLALVDPSPVVTVLAAVDSSTRTFRDGMQVETEALTMARTESGVRLLLNTGDHVPITRADTVCLVRIVGSRGTIEYGVFEQDYVLTSPDHDRERVTVEPFPVSAHQRHLEHLADQVESGTLDDLGPRTSLRALEVIEAAYESARVRGSITVPRTNPQPERVDDWNPGAAYSGSGGGRNGREL